MTRLASLSRADLDDEQQALFDEIAGGDRLKRFPPGDLVNEEGGLEGPFNALLLMPGIGRALQEVGTRLRTSGRLAPRLREIAILATAVHYRAQYEWYAHEPMARRAGLGEAEIAALKAGERPQFTDEAARAVEALAHGLLHEGRVEEDVYGHAKAAIGEAGIAEIVATTGYYATLAMFLNAFEVPLPKGKPLPFADES